jgi:mutator protein MutT
MKPISILIPFKIEDESCLFVWNQTRDSKDELNSLLEFPGGKIEANETPLDACMREVYEEVGIKLKNRDIDNFKTFSFNKNPGNLLIINVFLFQDKNSLFPSNGWLKLEDIKPDQILPNNVLILKEFLSYYQQVMGKHHD